MQKDLEISINLHIFASLLKERTTSLVHGVMVAQQFLVLFV